MDFDNEFYKQWKTKATTNQRFFRDTPDFSTEKMDSEKIFSSTALDGHQVESQAFSLRLSTESYVDETPESSEPKTKEKQIKEVILISDTSSDESIFSVDEIGNKSKLASTNRFRSQKKTIKVLETSDDETPDNLDVQDFDFRTSDKVNELLKTLARQESKESKESKESNVVIEESDTEIEERTLPQIIKSTVVESVTLSERKKKEILQWLSTNFDSSRCGSSCSQESAIADSRKSGLSSGNSSLERLELNFETPNNRGKVSKPGTVDRANRRKQSDLEKQNTIDQYFDKSKKGQLDIVRDRTPGSKKSDSTPVNNVKVVSRRVILPEPEAYDTRTPRSQKSDKTPVNNVNTKSRRVLIPESESIGSKTPSSQKSNKTPTNNVNTKSRRVLIPESESKDSKTPSSQTSNKILSDNVNTKPRRAIIPQSDAIDSKTPSSHKSNRTPVTNEKTSFKKAVIPETQSFESSSTEPQDAFKKLTIGNSKPQKTVIIPESFEISDDIETLDESSDIDLKNKENEQESSQANNITNDTTINDCADILENLYGATWRNKASALICATEPRKQTTKKLIKDVQTEKKTTFRNPRLEFDSDSELSDKENYRNVQKKQSQTTSKKSKVRNRVRDDFLNDDSTTESSPDLSYYTATSNPAQNNFNTATTAAVKRNNNNNNLKKVLSICDSESELENDKWVDRNNQRKLSFDSSSSSTSEFDPEDIVPPRPTTKNLKVKKAVNCEPVKSKACPQAQKQPTKKSFLASLSKDVPLDQADFKAMTYRVKYNTLREELCNVLYKLFNEKVFDSQLPDNIPIEWSTRLRGTAGKCYNKQSLKALGKTVRSSRLVLATKILDSPDRLRDTLIHEMCHAATWLINNVSDGHGSFWKAWANKAVKVFPELPPVSRCHNYEIQTKYTYKCLSCGYSIGRHSKSLDLSRKRCGYCHGQFELLINKVTKDGMVQKKSTAQTKEPSGFALYVKENYHLVKQNGAGIKHGEVMKILGQQFSAVKLTPKPEDRLRNNEDESP
ncbi:acidic repeat-containing protein [Nasonia vitripennis]|uniref:SprT-like domain-containing protein n=1 Tax=Nasonia vitripennis TaxID=7425 RepID=A0A7M7LU59_NASVI|nr:acidic repeat-containing protein [Nasonia vitripennis]